MVRTPYPHNENQDFDHQMESAHRNRQEAYRGEKGMRRFGSSFTAVSPLIWAAFFVGLSLYAYYGLNYAFVPKHLTWRIILSPAFGIFVAAMITLNWFRDTLVDKTPRI